MATILENVYSLSAHLENAYNALEAKGATIPATKNATNLSATIDTVPAGGSESWLDGAELSDFFGVNIDGTQDMALASYPKKAVTMNCDTILSCNRVPFSPTISSLTVNASKIGYWGMCEFMCSQQYVGNSTSRNIPRGLKEVIFTKPLSCAERGLNRAFALNTQLEKASLSVYDGEYACANGTFQECTSLKDVTADLSVRTTSGIMFAGMFSGCTALSSASGIVLRGNSAYAYNSMFNGCTSLTSMPAMPEYESGKTIPDNCFTTMFQGCTKLTALPEFPYKRLGSASLQRMFSGCTSLSSIPELEFEYLYSNCCQYMFQNCTSLSGTATVKLTPGQYFTSIPSGAMQNMFQGCSNLTKVILDFSTFSSIPTLGGVNYINVFNSTTDTRLEIRVPSSLVDTWKTASNWSTWASHIIGV